MKVEVSNGELLDKLSILELKLLLASFHKVEKLNVSWKLLLTAFKKKHRKCWHRKYGFRHIFEIKKLSGIWIVFSQYVIENSAGNQ